MPPAIILGPVAKTGALVGDLPIVEVLHLSRLEVEVDGHVRTGHDLVERVERRQARGVQLQAGQGVPVLDLKARESSGEPSLVELEDRMLDHLHVIVRMLALPVEKERLVQTGKELGMSPSHLVVRLEEA